MHSGGQVAKKSGGEDVVRCGEAMGAKKDLAFGEPVIQGCIPFKLPKGKSGTDVEMDDIAVVIVDTPNVGDTDAIHILGEPVAGWDITFHHDVAKRRHHVKWENVVHVVDVLEDLQEVTDEWLDGIIHNLFGGSMDVNMEKHIVQGVHSCIRVGETTHERCLGDQVKHQRFPIRRGASIGSINHHHHHQKVGICRNQYVCT